MEYNELTPDQQEDMVIAGTEFMRTVTEIWGPDKGMEVWDGIANLIGADFKGAVFFTMLTGTHLGDVRLTKASQNQYVENIKIVRAYTGYSLKEAKDACDRVRSGTNHVEKLPVMNKKQRKEFIQALRDCGCEAN